VVDWENRHMTCPQGKISRSWHEYITCHNTPTVGIHFSAPRLSPVSGSSPVYTGQNAWPFHPSPP
jgi:hypothetical protein